MRFLRRGSSDSSGQAGVPGWSDFKDPKDFDAFIDLVNAWLAANTREFHDRGDASIDVVTPTGEPLVVGLTNLEQMCRRSKRSDWPQLIAGHFASLMVQVEGPDLSFESARSMVKIRVFPEQIAIPDDPDPSKSAVTEVIAPGLRWILALDLPTTVRSLSRGDLGDWGRTPEEMYDLGLANVREQDVPLDRDLGDGVRLLLGDSFFVATWALMLERYLDPIPEHGALVALPHRHALAFKPISDLSVVQAISGMLNLAIESYREGPGSISPNLYWWRAGKLTLLPSRLEGKRVNFMPPDEFTEMLNSLPEAK
jgi:hypothetical protein